MNNVSFCRISDSIIFNVSYMINDPQAVFHDLAALAPALDLGNWPEHHPTFLLASEEERTQLFRLQKENARALGTTMLIGFVFSQELMLIFFFFKLCELLIYLSLSFSFFFLMKVISKTNFFLWAS